MTFEEWWEGQVGNSDQWTTLERLAAKDSWYAAQRLASSQQQPTLRDMFALGAMQGLMAAWGAHDVTDFDEISCDAYNLADAMLKERNK